MAAQNNLDSRSAFVNPLDKFQSHSIHYIMLAARTTEEAKAFTDMSQNAETLEAITRVTRLGEPVEYGSSTNDAFLVMDTRRFSHFSIEKLDYEVLINGLEAKASSGNFASTVNMTVLDAVGISFLNFLQWMMDTKMQCNFDGMIYMLRVLFVGTDVNGITETVQSVTIPMHLTKMNLDLTFARGAYDIEFMPNMNFDTVKHHRWTQIATSTTYTTPKGSNKLGDMVDAFEATLNKNSQEYFNKARAVLTDAGRSNNDGKSGFGRQVKYHITIPTEWRDFEYAGAASGGASETVFANTASRPGQANTTEKFKQQIAKPAVVTDSQLAVEAGTTITEVLDTMFKQTPEISRMGMGVYDKEKKESVTFYKHLVGITSNNDSVTLHVDIIPFEVPNVTAETTEKAGQDDAKFYQMVDGKRVPKNYFEYDYIFTGKNNDILEFDMKFQDLQWMLASNLDLGAGAFTGVSALDSTTSEGEATATTKANTTKGSELMVMRAYDPLLPPVQTAAEFENFSRYTSLLPRDKEGAVIKASQDYTKNLAAFYACAPIVANLTIRGNPEIMAKFNMPSFLPAPGETAQTTASSRSSQSKAAYRKSLEAEILLKEAAAGQYEVSKSSNGAMRVSTLGNSPYVNTPVFIRVNIKGPNVDFVTAEMVNGEEFTRDVLSDAYYIVMKVRTVIEGSNFTQQLQLYSHNIFGHGKITSATEQKTTRTV